MGVKEELEGKHPSKSQSLRKSGFGVASGLERLRGKGLSDGGTTGGRLDIYTMIPHSGYFGMYRTGSFHLGQACFGHEMEMYRRQYGEETSKAEK